MVRAAALMAVIAAVVGCSQGLAPRQANAECEMEAAKTFKAFYTSEFNAFVAVCMTAKGYRYAATAECMKSGLNPDACYRR